MYLTKKQTNKIKNLYDSVALLLTPWGLNAPFESDRSRSLSWSRNSPPFLECDGSLQGSAIGPAQSIALHPIYLSFILI
jgi:hypothetical protein